MLLSEFDLDKREARRVPSPGKCIYCYDPSPALTDEHVIPYALAANTLILEKSCCKTCQEIIQPYEQEVLKKQLGIFRAQVDAPTRNKKDRPTEARLHFFEANAEGELVRNLGSRLMPIGEIPVMFSLWASPPPRLLRVPNQPIDENGGPWTFVEKDVANSLCRAVGEEKGVSHVAMKVGEVNRLHYLRSLAKTAHAFAVATLGLDAFEPLLLDLILNRSNDVAEYVGDSNVDSPFDLHPAHTLQIAIGEAADGPAKGYLISRIQLYPMLNSPAHLVVLGKAIEDIGKRFEVAF